MATSTKKQVATNFRTFPATDLVDMVGIVPGLNIRQERNYDVPGFATEIASAGEIFEPIRITAMSEDTESDLEGVSWVVAGDGHRRVRACLLYTSPSPRDS